MRSRLCGSRHSSITTRHTRSLPLDHNCHGGRKSGRSSDPGEREPDVSLLRPASRLAGSRWRSINCLVNDFIRTGEEPVELGNTKGDRGSGARGCVVAEVCQRLKLPYGAATQMDRVLALVLGVHQMPAPLRDVDEAKIDAACLGDMPKSLRRLACLWADCAKQLAYTYPRGQNQPDAEDEARLEAGSGQGAGKRVELFQRQHALTQHVGPPTSRAVTVSRGLR